MNVSEYIFDFLSKKGVDTVFMVTGGQAMWLNDAVGNNKNYNIICTHHEQTAAMSADAYGRAKLKPAIALVTAGPGAVNAMNGVVGGWTDSSPMIVISGQANLSFVKYQDSTGIRQYGVQGINIKPLVQSVVKYFVTVDDPSMIKYYLEKAYTEATTGRPGPVWIDVPLDIQKSDVKENYLKDYFYNNSQTFNVSYPVDLLFKKLENSERPVFLVGQGVKLSGSEGIFIKLLEKVRAPVITARLGIDLIESDNDLYVGRPGNYGERSANFAIQNSDLIISIGCRLSSSLVGHNPSQFGKNAYIYVVDVDQKELDKPGPNIDFKLNCDCKVFLTELLNKAPYYKDKYLNKYNDWIKQCNYWKKHYPVCLDEYKDKKPINSYYFLDRLSDFAPSNANVLIDTGSCFHVACQVWKVKKGQRFLTTGGLSSMGYWCACIGACMANDKKTTIVVTGDGSLQMNIQEFATIKHNRLPIKLFVLNNDGYLLIRHTQHNFMNDRFVGEGPATGVWCPDTNKIADAYGIKNYSIDDPKQIGEVLKKMFEDDEPAICDVKCDRWQLLIPRITSDKTPDGRLVSRNYEDMFPFLPKEELLDNMVCYKKK